MWYQRGQHLRYLGNNGIARHLLRNQAYHISPQLQQLAKQPREQFDWLSLLLESPSIGRNEMAVRQPRASETSCQASFFPSQWKASIKASKQVKQCYFFLKNKQIFHILTDFLSVCGLGNVFSKPIQYKSVSCLQCTGQI